MAVSWAGPPPWPCPFSLVGNKLKRLPHRAISAHYQIARLMSAKNKSKKKTTRSLPLVGIIMGSQSDWETLQHCVSTLEDFSVPYEVRVVSAHRTPDLLFDYAGTAQNRGLEVIIAGAGGAAHLPGMAAAKTALPVLGVPVESKALKGLDSLLSIAQMPAGIPVGTLAIGKAGAINSALLAISIIANKHTQFRKPLQDFRKNQTQKVLKNPDPRKPSRR